MYSNLFHDRYETHIGESLPTNGNFNREGNVNKI